MKIIGICNVWKCTLDAASLSQMLVGLMRIFFRLIGFNVPEARVSRRLLQMTRQSNAFFPALLLTHSPALIISHHFQGNLFPLSTPGIRDIDKRFKAFCAIFSYRFADFSLLASPCFPINCQLTRLKSEYWNFDVGCTCTKHRSQRRKASNFIE